MVKKTVGLVTVIAVVVFAAWFLYPESIDTEPPPPEAAATGTPSVQSLRGASGLDAADQPGMNTEQDTGTKFPRTFAGQPPLIPHEMMGEITLEGNTCLDCHDRKSEMDETIPKASDNHYTDRAGNPTEEFSKARWFCTQCHVPQSKTDALVPNTFQTAE